LKFVSYIFFIRTESSSGLATFGNYSVPLAIVAVANKMLKIVWFMLKRRESYQSVIYTNGAGKSLRIFNVHTKRGGKLWEELHLQGE